MLKDENNVAYILAIQLRQGTQDGCHVINYANNEVAWILFTDIAGAMNACSQKPPP